MFKKRKYIGILGGTFDPPHSGHLFISNFSLIKLDLDEVWWIVTKKNPLKKHSSKYEIRLSKTKIFVTQKKIKILEIKDDANLFSIDLIKFLKKKFPNIKFIWLMGIDNLESFHLWKEWKNIFYNIPIAIFDRPSYSLSLYRSKALSFFRNRRINNKLAKKLKFMSPPKWVFLTGFLHSQSSTQIRKK